MRSNFLSPDINTKIDVFGEIQTLNHLVENKIVVLLIFVATMQFIKTVP